MDGSFIMYKLVDLLKFHYRIFLKEVIFYYFEESQNHIHKSSHLPSIGQETRSNKINKKHIIGEDTDRVK